MAWPSQGARRAMTDITPSQSRIARLEAVQAMLLQIGRLACTTHDLDAFLQATHAAVARIVYADNFFVALFDPADRSIRFAYFADEVDPPEDPQHRYPLRDPHESGTSWVILNGQPLILKGDDFADPRWHEELAQWRTGTTPAHWIGMPLRLSDERILGALVIQSYHAERTYSDEDIALFGLIADHIATLVERVSASVRLEQAIAERTSQLEHEVAERRRAEQLQRGLYEIAALSATDASLDAVYRAVHDVTARLMYARNFFIMLHHEDTQEFDFPYSVDEYEDPVPPGQRFPIWRGLTSYVVRTRQPQFVDPQRRAQLVRDGEIQQARGHLGIASWLGAPMIVAEHVYGVIVVQSYDPTIVHSKGDLDLLAYVATHVAGALSRREADISLRAATEQIRRRNEELTRTLDQLRNTQDELVRQEKMASLGGLVAGVAHEINTPLGICVTATSHIEEELHTWHRLQDEGHFDAPHVGEMLAELDVTMRVLDANIRRSAELVRSFKQIAVDQSSGARRQFDLHAYLDEVLLSLKPKLKRAPVKVQVDCPPGLAMDTYPGALSQVITNLVMNALLHAFEGRDGGNVKIIARADGQDVLLDVIDDGIGMSPGDLKHYFDPFFTTKRGSGGTGLGANIIFNQVTNVLGGSIRASSTPGAGLQVSMRLPRTRATAEASA